MKRVIRTDRSRRRGSTLVELAASALIAGVLATGLCSALLLSTRAGDDSSSKIVMAEADRALRFFASDVRCAKDVSIDLVGNFRFVVADRTGDGNDDTITYHWQNAGEPLIRTFNTEDPVTVIDSASSVYMDAMYDNSTTTSGTETQSQLVGGQSSSSSASTQDIDSTTQAGVYLFPSLPTTAVTWRPTIVRFQARATTTSTGTIIVEARTASGDGWPTSEVVGQASVDISAWTTSFAWQQVTLSSNWIAPTQGVSIVIRRGTTTNNIQLQYTSVSGATGGIVSTNSGTSWLLMNSKELRFQVYGEYTQPSGTTAVKKWRWLNMQVRLANADDAMSSVSVELLNRPEFKIE